jgi:hypothetical protein
MRVIAVRKTVGESHAGGGIDLMNPSKGYGRWGKGSEGSRGYKLKGRGG